MPVATRTLPPGPIEDLGVSQWRASSDNPWARLANHPNNKQEEVAVTLRQRRRVH